MQTNPAEHDAGLSLQLWGVRGSTPTPVAKNLGYGGNTTCASCEASAEELLIFDAGTGIRLLGATLIRRKTLPTMHLFFTHFHWDHVQGLPFFAPLFRRDARLVLYSVLPPEDLREVLARQMTTPYFPLELSQVTSRMEFRQVEADTVTVGGVTVQGFGLHHPQGSQGYRISDERRSIVFATDHEHGDEAADTRLRTVAKGADVLIYDAQYTRAEHETRRGWGHSTWNEAVCVARDAEVKKLVLFHHDPEHDDAMVDAIVAEAQREFPETVGAREAMSLQHEPTVTSAFLL